MTTTPSRITSTYTVVAMEVPKSIYDDIAAKLIAAGYDSVKDDMIDMHGIALVPMKGCPSCGGTRKDASGDLCFACFDPTALSSPAHQRALAEFRAGRKPAGPRERAAQMRTAAATVRTAEPTPEAVASMLEEWADIQEAIADAKTDEALTWRDVPPRPAYAPQNALVGDRVRPERCSSYGPIEKIEAGWMFVRMPDGELVQTDLAGWEDGAA